MPWQYKITQKTAPTTNGLVDLIVDVYKDGKVVPSATSLAFQVRAETWQTDVDAKLKEVRTRQIEANKIPLDTFIDIA